MVSSNAPPPPHWCFTTLIILCFISFSHSPRSGSPGMALNGSPHSQRRRDHAMQPQQDLTPHQEYVNYLTRGLSKDKIGSLENNKLYITGFMWSWKVMEFENAFSRPGKVMDFRQNGWGHGKVMEFLFLVQIFHAVWKLEIFSQSVQPLDHHESGQQAPQTRVSRGAWGHAPPENCENWKP